MSICSTLREFKNNDILYVIMRVEFTETNKTPLNYDRATLYLFFIHKSKTRKNHTLNLHVKV